VRVIAPAVKLAHADGAHMRGDTMSRGSARPRLVHQLWRVVADRRAIAAELLHGVSSTE
jgi:hypothetical protein